MLLFREQSNFFFSSSGIRYNVAMENSKAVSFRRIKHCTMCAAIGCLPFSVLTEYAHPHGSEYCTECGRSIRETLLPPVDHRHPLGEERESMPSRLVTVSGTTIASSMATTFSDFAGYCPRTGEIFPLPFEIKII